MDPYQHPDCLNNIHWIPAWYDLPEGADPNTHNPWLIKDPSTKQTDMEIFQQRIGDEELRRRVKAHAERMRDLLERPGHSAA